MNSACLPPDEECNTDTPLSKQMRGLRRKRQKFTRTLNRNVLHSGLNQKDSSFDYAAHREQNNNIPSANTQQICAATTLAKERSPLSKVKRDRSALKASLEASVVKQRRLHLTCKRNKKKITDLKKINNQLMQDILQERRTSNKHQCPRPASFLAKLWK